MSKIVEPQKFLEDFVRDIVANPGERPAYIKGYAAHLEAMLEAARREGGDAQGS